MPFRSFLLAIFLSVTAGACAAGGPAGDLAGTEWQLRALGGQPVPVEAWLGFEPGGRAGGSGGCNSFGGAYRHDGGSLSFERLQMTRMACEEPRMSVESAFLSALEATRGTVVADGTLRLLGEGGATLATLARRDAD